MSRPEKYHGAGVLKVPMQLLLDVEVRCPDCLGRLFKEKVLEAKYKGYSRRRARHDH